MKNSFRIIHILIMAVILLTSCNLPNDQSAQATAAAQTVEALTSATPLFNTTPSITPTAATFTPFPTLNINTNTPAATATSNCNVAQFLTDVTIPDGTVLAPGASFTKKWRLKNIGSCAWNGFSMAFDSGDSMGGPASKAVAAVNPGQEVDLEVSLTAPSTVGNYRGYWRLVTNGNVLVPVVNGYQGKSFYVDIKVQNAVTATNTTGPFAVTGVTFSNSGGCGGFNTTANITTNSAGSVTYHWVRSDGAVDTVSHPAIVYGAAGTQTVSTSWSASAAGTYWIDIYIDTPNHQQFGRATFTCP
jgi:hypothetical protein